MSERKKPGGGQEKATTGYQTGTPGLLGLSRHFPLPVDFHGVGCFARHPIYGQGLSGLQVDSQRFDPLGVRAAVGINRPARNAVPTYGVPFAAIVGAAPGRTERGQPDGSGVSLLAGTFDAGARWRSAIPEWSSHGPRNSLVVPTVFVQVCDGLEQVKLSGTQFLANFNCLRQCVSGLRRCDVIVQADQ
jgi:hypothetical protein